MNFSSSGRVRKIYVASSWRNEFQPVVVNEILDSNHEVYDFKNPAGGTGFSWKTVHPDWQKWSSAEYLAALKHPLAEKGFASDWEAMQWADTGVLVMPCGRSAHIEAGYFVGANKPLYILLGGDSEPELMYKMATGIFTCLRDLITELNK